MPLPPRPFLPRPPPSPSPSPPVFVGLHTPEAIERHWKNKRGEWFFTVRWVGSEERTQQPVRPFFEDVPNMVRAYLWKIGPQEPRIAGEIWVFLHDDDEDDEFEKLDEIMPYHQRCAMKDECRGGKRGVHLRTMFVRGRDGKCAKCCAKN
jgi:hypothetical protein